MSQERRIHININDNVIIRSDEDLEEEGEEDDNLEDQQNQANLGTVRVQQRIILPALGQYLGLREGVHWFFTGSENLRLFKEYKVNIRNYQNVQLVEHQDQDLLIEVDSTTLLKTKYTREEVDKEISKELTKQKYTLFIRTYDSFKQ